MKWTGFAIVAAVALIATTDVCLAESPEWVSGQPAAGGSPFRRGSMFNASNWWSRYGEPVSRPAVVEGGVPGKGGPVVDVGPGPVGIHGPDYVYGPGACDYTEPCTDHLWNGYWKRPLRCYPPGHFALFKHRGCGCHVANDCGCGATVGCSAPTCSEPVCEAQVAACDCEPVTCCGSKWKRHFHVKKNWFAHWHWGKKGCCDSCSAPIDCGCAAPILEMPGKELPPQPFPSKELPPPPAPEQAATLNLPLLNNPLGLAR